MKRKRGWLLVPLVILALLLCAIPAYAIPTIPHSFYGTITIDDDDAPVGTVVTAEVGGVECGSITTTVEGQYGGSGAFDEKLSVSGDIDTGATISFYTGGTEADQTYAFSAGDVTELNLTFPPSTDTTAPTVSSTSPADGETGVVIGTPVSVTFSEAMASATITTTSFTLDSVAGSISYDSGTYTATFTPDANLALATTYTATLSTAITDVAGNPLAAEETWGFTTTGIAPTVVDKSPAADATDVATYTTVTATFDMAMDESTITIHTFLLDGVAGSVSYDSGTYTATLTPDANLDGNTTYTATLSTAITSADGIALASAYSWSFTTVLPGDANQDGSVNALDITKVELIVAGVHAETPGADANQDGNVNALDITKTELIAAGLG